MCARRRNRRPRDRMVDGKISVNVVTRWLTRRPSQPSKSAPLVDSLGRFCYRRATREPAQPLLAAVRRPAPPEFDRINRRDSSVQVLVRDNNVDQALKALKKKMQREGIFREMK